LSKKNHPFIKNQLPAILWGCLIFALSSIPSKNLPHIGLFPNADKVIHAGLFFVFCGLAHRAFRYQPNRLLVQLSLFFALVATVVYGCSDEFHQLFVMGRTADIYDMLADISGGVLYAAFFMLIVRPRIKPGSEPIGS
jgi:hypothetical protein